MNAVILWKYVTMDYEGNSLNLCPVKLSVTIFTLATV